MKCYLIDSLGNICTYEVSNSMRVRENNIDVDVFEADV